MDQLWQLSERAKEKVMEGERGLPNGLLSEGPNSRQAVGEGQSSCTLATQMLLTPVLVWVMAWHKWTEAISVAIGSNLKI